MWRREKPDKIQLRKYEKIYLYGEMHRKHYQTTKGLLRTTYSDICPGRTRYTDISLQYLKGE